MDNKNNLYWCDYCSTNTIDNEGNEGVEYYGCYSQQAYVKHIKTPKHLKAKSNILEGVVCDKCSKTFTAEGYAIHEKRNKPLWECYKTTDLAKMTCNNFSVGKKRYESVEHFKIPKRKQKRVKVGSYSPVTNSTRQPNTKGGKQRVSKSLEDADQVTSDDTDTEEQDIIEIAKYIKLYKESKKKRQQEEQEELKKLGLDDTKTEIIKNKNALNDDEVDITERPQFDEICDNCSLPINYDYPTKLLDNWGIDTCPCSDDD